MEPESISRNELIELCAVDGVFFAHTFFPKSCRIKSPMLHYDIWRVLESRHRFINIQVFRGGSKTTLLRQFSAKCISFYTHPTIVYIGKSEGHATRSIEWIRSQILFNTRWTQTFGLKKGKKFQGTEAQIFHEGFDEPIWIVGVGIEGSVRGINLDDYRPSLIILDDVISEDNALSVEAREKLGDLIYGAVKDSLAPVGDAPNAKMVMLNTPQQQNDPSMLALKDPEWKSFRMGCWTRDTEELPLHDRQSSWEEMFPTEELQKEKKFAILRGKVHVFNREKECRITAPEGNPLRHEWLKTYTERPLLEEFSDLIYTVDPVPKPTASQIAKNLHGKDFEVHQIWGLKGKERWLLGWWRNRGHEPNWSVNTFMSVLRSWRIRMLVVDSIAYQSTLAWLFQQAMKDAGVYCQIKEVPDKRSKYNKIVDAYSGPGSAGMVYVPETYSDFIEQWHDYPNCSHDDDLDSGHMALDEYNRMLSVSTGNQEYAYEGGDEEENDYEPCWGAP